MFTKEFWKDAAERAIKTFAQTLVALLSVAVAAPIWDLNWVEALGVAGTATALSLLTSIAGSGTGNPETGSFIKDPYTPPVDPYTPEYNGRHPVDVET